MAGGRPTVYTPELAAKFCARMIEESVRKICEDPEMPSETTIFRWLGDPDNEVFREQYARAMDARSDARFEQMESLALGATPETVQCVKLHIDTLKWTLARQRPKKYGDKVTQEVTGADGGPINTAITVRFVEGDDDGDNDSGSV